MDRDVVFIGDPRGERTVHSSVRIPASLHAYAKTRKISLSRTLSATLAAVRDEEMKDGTEATPTKQKAPIPTDPSDPDRRYGH
jgi:hypothetical protein